MGEDVPPIVEEPVYQTVRRITSSTTEGFVAIPAGSQVDLIYIDGKTFVKYGRILVDVTKVQNFRKEDLMVVDKSNTTSNAPVLSPPTTGGEENPGAADKPKAPINPVALAAIGNGLTEEERHLLLKGRPDPSIASEVRALDQVKLTNEAAYRFRLQQITREEAEIRKSQGKGKIVSNGKVKLEAFELQKAQMLLERQRASLAYNQKIADLKATKTKQILAYDAALAKMNALNEQKQLSSEKKAEESN